MGAWWTPRLARSGGLGQPLTVVLVLLGWDDPKGVPQGSVRLRMTPSKKKTEIRCNWSEASARRLQRVINPLSGERGLPGESVGVGDPDNVCETGPRGSNYKSSFSAMRDGRVPSPSKNETPRMRWRERLRGQ